MKRILLLLFTLPLFVACSMNDTDSVENTTTETEDQEETVATEPSAEEKMMQELPASAELDAWNLVLVNPDTALADDFTVDLASVENEQRIDARIVDAWDDWYQAAREAGHRLFLASAYRDVARQETNFNQKINEYLNEGLSEEEAKEKAKEYLTEPGHSEHHTGLALDIVDEEWIVAGRKLETEYENEASQQWLIDTMTDYGFILRYPKGEESITKIEYEPWHFRYVGSKHAKFMEKYELTLEEYIDLIKQTEAK